MYLTDGAQVSVPFWKRARLTAKPDGFPRSRETKSQSPEFVTATVGSPKTLAFVPFGTAPPSTQVSPRSTE